MNGRVDQPAVDILRQPVAATLGLRRVAWVRVSVTDGATTCQVVGSGHRWVCTRQIPLATALRLHASGVPTVFRSFDRTATTARSDG